MVGRIPTMKKIYKIIIIAFFFIIITSAIVYKRIDDKLIVYMDGIPISKLKMNDSIYVYVDEISKFGFDYKTIGDNLYLYENPLKKATVNLKSRKYHKNFGGYIEENENPIEYSHFFGWKIVKAKDLQKAGCSYYLRTNEKNSQVFINSKFNHLIKSKDSFILDVDIRESKIFINEKESGKIVDGVEMISLDSIVDLLGFDIKLMKRVDKGYSVEVKKSNLKIKFNLTETENAYEVYIDGTDMHKNPIKEKYKLIDGKIHISMKDLKDIFDFRDSRNLELENSEFGCANAQNLDNMVYCDKAVYFIGRQNSNILKLNIKDRKVEVLVDCEASEIASDGSSIFYLIQGDGIYSFDTQENSFTKLAYGNYRGMSASEGWIYFSDIESKKFLMMDLETLKVISIDETSARDLVKIGNSLVFIDEMNGNRLTKIELTDFRKMKISDLYFLSLNSDGKKIYAYTGDEIYSIDLDGSSSVIIADDVQIKNESLLIFGEKVLWQDGLSVFSIMKNGANKKLEYQGPNIWDEIGLVLYDDRVIIMGIKIENIIYAVDGGGKVNEIERLGNISDIKAINGKEVYYESKNDKIYLKRTDQYSAFEISDEIYKIYGISGEWIYYYNFNNDIKKSGLYKMKKNRSDREKIEDYNFKMPKANSDGVYIIEAKYGSMGDLYKIDPVTDEKKLVQKTDDKHLEMQYELIDKGVLFTQSDGIYIRSKNGKVKRIMRSKTPIDCLRIYGDEVCYMSDGALSVLNLKTLSNKELVENGVKSFLYKYNNELYYREKNSKIRCMDLKTGKTNVVSDKNFKSIGFVTSNEIYFVNENDKVFVLQKDKKYADKVGTYYPYLYTDGGELFYYTQKNMKYEILEMKNFLLK